MTFNRIVLLQILVLQLFISSCAYINAQRDDVDSLITKWLVEQEFDKATNTLNNVKTTHPQYLKLMLRKKEIVQKSNTFIAITIKQAQYFTKEKKWGDAYTVYNFALNRVAEDKKLNGSYKTYLKNRAIYVNKLKQKLLVHNAARLIKDIPIQREIALAIKETSVEQNKFKKLQKQATYTVTALVQCSTDYLKLKKVKISKKCLQLALDLGPSEELSKQIKQNQIIISELSASKNKKKQQAKSNSKSKTLKEYQAAFDKNDLVTANKKLDVLLKENKNNYELSKLKTILDESINKKLKTGIEAGRILYSKGNIKLALDQWRRLKKLDPENIELKSHISRAERVLRKLRTLTHKDQTANDSGG